MTGNYQYLPEAKNTMGIGHCIVIGASHAGTSLALQLRKEGWQGAITLISEEPELPYHRPPLSKDYLAGTKELDQLRLRPEKAFVDNNIDLRLGCKVVNLDSGRKTVELSDGATLEYEKLALCTGASAIALSLGSAMKGVHCIRNVADILLIKQELSSAKSAIIIGGGYIGLEAAAVLAKIGLDVTVLEMAERVLARVTSAPMSQYMEALHEEHGVKILTSTKVSSLEGESSVETVVCENGQRLSADLVIVGIGVRPNTELAAQGHLAIENGIVVNNQGLTSDPNIYAAGDCTNHPSALYETNLRLESVQNANDQGRVVAANICGHGKVYDAVPWFWSDQYEVKLQMVGLSSGYDQLVVRGDAKNTEKRGFALFYFKDKRLIAADCIARPKEFMAAKKLVAAKSEISPDILADENVEPLSFLQN
ncbi:MAG: NAD(P)/FAD-dependent oxidoreductase [Pseudohongiellaceae bacterium]